MKLKMLLILTTSLVSSSTFAHGEDKKGPHGGYIQMPGAFHTEVVPEGKNRMRVYLLDMNWMNPVVDGSSVTLKIKNQKQSLTAKCEAIRDSFLCVFDGDPNLGSGHLIVESKRNGQVGNQVSYSLPLALKAATREAKDTND